MDVAEMLEVTIETGRGEVLKEAPSDYWSGFLAALKYVEVTVNKIRAADAARQASPMTQG